MRSGCYGHAAKMIFFHKLFVCCCKNCQKEGGFLINASQCQFKRLLFQQPNISEHCCNPFLQCIAMIVKLRLLLFSRQLKTTGGIFKQNCAHISKPPPLWLLVTEHIMRALGTLGTLGTSATVWLLNRGVSPVLHILKIICSGQVPQTK